MLASFALLVASLALMVASLALMVASLALMVASFALMEVLRTREARSCGATRPRFRANPSRTASPTAAACWLTSVAGFKHSNLEVGCFQTQEKP